MAESSLRFHLLREAMEDEEATADRLADLPRIVGAAVVKLAYTMDSKSIARKGVRVQVPPAAPLVRGAHDSKSCIERCVGSTPTTGTKCT